MAKTIPRKRAEKYMLFEGKHLLSNHNVECIIIFALHIFYLNQSDEISHSIRLTLIMQSKQRTVKRRLISHPNEIGTCNLLSVCWIKISKVHKWNRIHMVMEADVWASWWAFWTYHPTEEAKATHLIRSHTCMRVFKLQPYYFRLVPITYA